MQEQSAVISVIVCTYNQEDTIGRTIESILRQECQWPVEIVIGEDGSTDRTLSVCQTYQKRHPDKIRILANPVNKGFVRNYFDCLRACRGKYIADCAGDDFWIDNLKLEKEARVLEANEGIGLVHTDWQRFDERTQELTMPTVKAHGQWSMVNGQRSMVNAQWTTVNGQTLLEDILMPGERPAIHLCTALYRNDWIRRAMHEHPQFFDPENYRCEDVQIAFFLARMGDVAFLPERTLAYSCGKASISNPDSEEKHFHFWANATRLSYDLAHSFGIRSERLDRFFQARIHKLLMHAFRSGKPSLRTEALQMQRQMGIADNRQTLFAKTLLLPGVWQTMRFARNIIKG